jgi:hypothetical protein
MATAIRVVILRIFGGGRAVLTTVWSGRCAQPANLILWSIERELVPYGPAPAADLKDATAAGLLRAAAKGLATAPGSVAAISVKTVL